MWENTLAECLPLTGEWSITTVNQSGKVQVPGVWERQGYGRDSNWAIYYRLIDVPADWAGARVKLRCGAVSYRCEVQVNGAQVGVHEGLWTAFECDVTDALRAGEPNEIELRIVKPSNTDGQPYSYRDVLVGFIPYVSNTFGGPWQDMLLTAHREPAFSGVHVAPDMASGTLRARLHVAGERADLEGLSLLAQITDRAGNAVARDSQPASAEAEFNLIVDHPHLWSPESPALYRFEARLLRDGQPVAGTSRPFGWRELSAAGDQLRLNGQPIHLRGVLSWGWDPDTLAPNPSDEAIRDEFRRCRALGFNLVKLCLFVPPDRLFQIADEEGMLLWLELPMWLPRLSEHLRAQAAAEYRDILAAAHHHPGIVIYSLGCELSADMADAALLDALSTLTREAVCGALVCDNSGSGEAYRGLAFDYADFNDYHFYCDLHYFTPLIDHFRRDWRLARPWIFGEFCDCDDYRDPAELVEEGRRPWWRDLIGVDASIERWAYSQQEERMAALRLPFSDTQIKTWSRRSALVVRKTILEKTRARQDIGGYVVTGLRDTPISTSGVFDDLGRAKAPAEDWLAINGETVLLLEQGRARAWTNGGDRPAPADRFNHWAGESVSLRVVLAHSGRPLRADALRWTLTGSDGQDALRGEIALGEAFQAGPPRQIAHIEWTAPAVERAAEYTFAVELGDVRNRWPLWIYPAAGAWPESVTVYDPAGALADLADLPRHDFTREMGGVLITAAYTPSIEAYVRSGGRIIALQSGPGALPVKAVPFWREAIKLLYDHRLLADFPHQGHADLQFYHLASDYAFDMAAFPAAVTPIIRRLDARLFTILDYLVEFRVGAGRALASTLRFSGGAGDQTAGLNGNVAGRYLLGRMVDDLRRGA